MQSAKVLRDSFSKIAALYDKVRPDYPKKLIDDIVMISRINKGSKILEVGCGSGQATKQFLGKGFDIRAIDPGKSLITIARKKVKGVKFSVCRFEDTWFDSEFELIISAQAFHWVDQKIGYEIAKKALKKNGHMAVFWNSILGTNDAIGIELRKILKKYTHKEKKYRYNARMIEFKKRIIKSGFKDVKVKEYERVITYIKKEFFDYVHSQSFISTLKSATKKKFDAEFNSLLKRQPNKIIIHAKTTLIIGKKT